MTQNLERTGTPGLHTEPLAESPAVSPRRQRPFWRRPWVLPLWAAAIAFLIYQLPPWVALDPAASRIPRIPVYYWLVAGHVLFGTIALVTMCLQLWPWLRRTHPKVHRVSGRIYVFGGALPSAAFALASTPYTFPVGKMGVLMSATLWCVAAVLGFVRARQGRWSEHRRYMLYSFAIMWGLVVWGFVIGMGWFWLSPWTVDPTYVIEASRWVGWVGNLIAVQWWLERTRTRKVEGPARTR